MSEWKEYKLGEIADVQTGPFGSQLHQSDYVSFGTPCIMPTNIGPQLDIKTEGIAYVKDEDVKRLEKHCVKAGDIIYSRRGDIEKCAFIRKDEEGWLCGTGCLRIRIKAIESNPHFIAYQLSTKECKKWIVGNAVGTTMLNLNTGILKELPLLLPDKSTQDSVVSVLKSLDDKIEVNRRINENLEQQAQALFKSWFVDFEPFKNGEFVESEFGMIPKGWRVGKLSSFGKVICGKTPSKAESSYYGGDMPFIKIPDMHNKVFVEQSEDNLSRLGDESQSAKRIPPYSILVSCIATVGLVCINTKESHTNQQINTIIPDLPIFRYYLYQKLLSIKDYLINLGRGGTATLNVNTKTFGNIKIIKPQDDVLSEYEELVTPLFNKIERNQEQSRRLAELRDTLLPKLMSGELKVNEIEI